MRSSITVPCSCGKQINLEIVGSQPPKSAHCSGCQASIWLVAPLGNIVTGLMMERAKHELANKDATVAILLSSTAVEGQMSYLYFKWKGIDSGKLPLAKEDKDQWENHWAEMRSLGKRLDELSRLLTNMCFDHFAQQNKALLKPALDTFDPSDSIKDYFQEQFFEKRNRIAHYGEIDFEESDGKRCFAAALALIGLLNAMDQVRIKKMDEAHKQASAKSVVGNSP